MRGSLCPEGNGPPPEMSRKLLLVLLCPEGDGLPSGISRGVCMCRSKKNNPALNAGFALPGGGLEPPSPYEH